MKITVSAIKLLTLLLIACSTAACNKTSPVTPVIPVDTTTAVFAKGADISWLTEMEAAGRKFYDTTGAEQDLIALLKSYGINTIRLRVWVNPAGGWNNTADVVAKAQRAKAKGMRIMIDFHYSDTWADPGAQTKPAAWATLDIAGLKDALKQHTTAVLNAIKLAGITPEWVQVGNEVNDGMLWPEGKASVNMNTFTQFINTGYDAVKAVFPTAKVIVHVSNGWNNALYQWLFDGLKNYGGKFDVIGMSLYPSSSGWPTTNAQCLANMNDMAARYNKEVMVVEVGMSHDEPEATRNFLSDIISKTKLVTNHKGSGVIYWEPEAYNWNAYPLGAFDDTGKPTIALNAFR